MSQRVNDVLHALRAVDGNAGNARAFDKLKQMFDALTPEEKDEFGRRAAKQPAGQVASLPKDDAMMGDRYA